MSEERWDELGVTRGHFLRRLVVGAFVAPIVVSFGLDGVASAQPGQQSGNQTSISDRYPNDKGGGAFANGGEGKHGGDRRHGRQHGQLLG